MIRGPRTSRLARKDDPRSEGRVEGRRSRDAPLSQIYDGVDTERISAALLRAHSDPSTSVATRPRADVGRSTKISGVAVGAASAMTLSLIANGLAPKSLIVLMLFAVPMWLVQVALWRLPWVDRTGVAMLLVVAVALALGLGQLFVPDQMGILRALVLVSGVVVPTVVIWRAKADATERGSL